MTKFKLLNLNLSMKLQTLVFLLALVVRAANRPADYDSDEEYIGGPRQQIRQPLINRPAVPATGVSVAGTLDQRPSRNDAWSTRMREKVRNVFIHSFVLINNFSALRNTSVTYILYICHKSMDVLCF